MTDPKQKEPKPGKSASRLDAINIKILEVLQKSARITFPKLSQHVGLSASPCFIRVQKLEKSGLIKGYYANIDLDVLAPHVLIFATAVIDKHDQKHDSRFRDLIKEMPEIIAAFQVSGGFDYLLQIVCKDIAHYQELASRILAGDASVSKLESHIVFDTIKDFTGYPIREIADVDQP